jgi:exonuclease VII large subunit
MFVSKKKNEQLKTKLEAETKRKNSLSEELERTRKELREVAGEYAKKEKEFIARTEIEFDRRQLELERKLELKYHTDLEKQRAEYDGRLKKGLEENYRELKKSLSDLHREGNAQTKFVKEFSMKMLESSRLTQGNPQIENKVENIVDAD